MAKKKANKFTFKKQLARGGGFEERELREVLKKGDVENAVARFLELQGRLDRALDLIDKLRGGESGPPAKCLPGCGRWKVWVGEGKDARWICPNCVWKQLKAFERAKSGK